MSSNSPFSAKVSPTKFRTSIAIDEVIRLVDYYLINERVKFHGSSEAVPVLTKSQEVLLWHIERLSEKMKKSDEATR